jgi:hypothetical protein
MSNPQYHRIIRKLVIGFGNLFNNITLVRYNKDTTESHRMLVPIAYSEKELYVQRLQADPELNKKVQMTLPRMSFEMNGLTYDSSRKLNTNIKQFAQTAEGVISQYNPVPYNFDFSLYLYVRNIEDGTQIIEQILPFFTPDYTIKLNLIPEMGIIKEVPIILNSATPEIDYEGEAARDTRYIIWTLTFTVKGFIFGKTSDVGGLIKTSITNILTNINANDNVEFTMSTEGSGTYKLGELVYQGYSRSTATASGVVVAYNNDTLTLKNIIGNFVSNLPIVGLETNASYNFLSYKVPDQELARIYVTPSPTDANANTAYTYTTEIQEYPNINNNLLPTNLSGNVDIQLGNDDFELNPENQTDLN